MHLLIAAKKTGARITWFDPVENRTMTRTISPGDLRVWVRFVMSFIVNGVAFHILVHALPIQIAAQSTLTGVVIRALGMVYLVDLDDTSGYTMTIVEEDEKQKKKGKDAKSAKEDATNNGFNSYTPPTQPPPPPDTSAFADETRRIIAEAQAKLDALSRRNYQSAYDRTSLKPGLGGLVLGETKESDQVTQSAGVRPGDYHTLYDRTSFRPVPWKDVSGGSATSDKVTELDRMPRTEFQGAYDRASLKPSPGKVLFAGTIESNEATLVPENPYDTIVGDVGRSDVDDDAEITA
jgi:hypothetical protein